MNRRAEAGPVPAALLSPAVQPGYVNSSVFADGQTGEPVFPFTLLCLIDRSLGPIC